MMDKDYKKIVDATILHMSDCDTLEEALKWFEEERKSPQSKMVVRAVKEMEGLFDIMVSNQLAVLWKVKVDCGDVKLKDNVMKLKKEEKK